MRQNSATILLSQESQTSLDFRLIIRLDVYRNWLRLSVLCIRLYGQHGFILNVVETSRPKCVSRTSMTMRAWLLEELTARGRTRHAAERSFVPSILTRTSIRRTIQ